MVTQEVSQIIQSDAEVKVPESQRLGRLITTRIVGISFEGRQEAAAKVRLGDLVWLVRQPTNRYDSNAIAITRENNESLGYVNRHLASRLAPFFDAFGYPVQGVVVNLIGGTHDYFSLGLVIRFRIPEKENVAKNHQLHQFLNWDD
jgi:hypothetical protein